VTDIYCGQAILARDEPDSPLLVCGQAQLAARVVSSPELYCREAMAAVRPKLIRLTPVRRQRGGAVSILGCGFALAAAIVFAHPDGTADIPLADVPVWQDQEAYVIVPAGAETGPNEVGLVDDGGDPVTNTLAFEVLA
jgi:hypothetical protein